MTEEVRRHFTATGYVVGEQGILLHWHELQMWLPPGGHIEENEDPVQAAMREAKEETGLDVRVLHPGGPGPFEFEIPQQLHPPVTILVEDIDDPIDGFHQHIDSIYFTEPVTPSQAPVDGWRWVSRQELIDRVALPTTNGQRVVPPPDVLEVGVVAIDAFLARRSQ